MGRAGKYAVKFFQLLCTSHLPPLFGRRYKLILSSLTNNSLDTESRGGVAARLKENLV